MALLGRLYYNAVFGGLGGLLGWMLFGIFGDKNPDAEHEQMQMLLGGTLIGGCIGYLVVAVEAIRDEALIRFARLATYGMILGAIGGALGMLLGDSVKYLLTNVFIELGVVGEDTTVNVVSEMVSRGLAWTVLGVAIGMSEGLAARSLGKLSYGTLGGALGGFLGGCLFGLFYYIGVQGQAVSSLWANALGLVILGACIGMLSALVQAVFQPACVKVLRGWQEGREYSLDKAATLLGRDEHADIALFRDMKVEKKHAFVQRVGARFLLINNDAPAKFTLINDTPVPKFQELHDGDRIQLGNILLRFQARAAVNRRGQRKTSRPA
jgi:hypothetical protein